jgi:hypothetical protein
VLRFEAITHNTKQLGCGRVLDRFPEIITRLAGMVERFCTTLDCVDVSFIGDQLLDQLPAPTQIGATRVGGIDLNKPRLRAALSAALVLAAAPGGFTVAEFTAKLHAMTGQTDSDYSTRQGAYDLRKLREGPPRQTRPVPPLPPPRPGRPHHRRAARPARARHRPHPRRRPQPPPRAQTRHLDPHRPRLREPPHRHADPVPRPRHHRRCRRGIDNILSIGTS